MTDLSRWADARLADVQGRADVELVADERFEAIDGSDSIGRLRILQGATTIVESRLTLPSHGIDSAMLHAFAPSGSTSPHLLSDLAALPDGRWHFHVDLLPRVDLITDPAYLDTVFPPLTAAYERAYAIPEHAPISIPLRLRALSSPWLVGVVVTPDDAVAIGEIHHSYTARWANLLETPPRSHAPLESAALVRRDEGHRAALFDDATDPVWSFVASIVGETAASSILTAVRTPR